MRKRMMESLLAQELISILKLLLLSKSNKSLKGFNSLDPQSKGLIDKLAKLNLFQVQEHIQWDLQL